MLKIRDEILAQAGYAVVLGIHNENDGALLQNDLLVISVATNPSADETIGIGSRTYTFKASGATGNQINLGGSAAVTALNIANKINSDMIETGCTAFVLGLPTVIALVSNTIGSQPTFTADGAKVVLGKDWSDTIPQADLEDDELFKVALTIGDAKPVILTERNSGTYQNFLY